MESRKYTIWKIDPNTKIPKKYVEGVGSDDWIAEEYRKLMIAFPEFIWSVRSKLSKP